MFKLSIKEKFDVYYLWIISTHNRLDIWWIKKKIQIGSLDEFRILYMEETTRERMTPRGTEPWHSWRCQGLLRNELGCLYRQFYKTRYLLSCRMIFTKFFIPVVRQCILDSLPLNKSMSYRRVSESEKGRQTGETERVTRPNRGIWPRRVLGMSGRRRDLWCMSPL